MNQAIIFDLDGTLCDVEHRRRYVTTEPRNWDAFNAACVLDKPVPHVLLMFSILWDRRQAFGYEVLFCSGRSGKHWDETVEWLCAHLDLEPHEVNLRMRAADDRRPDNLVKKDMLDDIRKTHEVLFAVDDRNQVVDMWRENGVPCFQCAPGDF